MVAWATWANNVLQNTHSHLQTLQSHEGVALSHAFGGVCQIEITENGMKTALLPNKQIGNWNKEDFCYLNMKQNSLQWHFNGLESNCLQV